MDLKDMYRIFYPTRAEYTFLHAHKTFSRIDHVSHKTTLCEFKEIDIIPSVFLDHNGMKQYQ